MQKLLIRLFLPHADQIHDPKVHAQYGMLSGIVGIVLNILLAGGKFVAGILAGSVSITADAINNLSDAGSSIISLLGFKLAAKPADAQHPFGHQRIEYLASLLIAFIILLLGVDLIRTSVDKILHPEAVRFSYLSLAILGASILIKFWMFRFNTNLSRRISSTALKATAADSLSDMAASAAVLLSSVLSQLLHIELDGYIGILVALFILYNGIQILKETFDQLIGETPPSDLSQTISDFVLSYDAILNVHDLMIHCYGANRCFASIHAEVSANDDLVAIHDIIDNIEKEIHDALNVHLVIHLDPVIQNDPEIDAMRKIALAAAKKVDPSFTIHDFRLVQGPTHSNLIFDVVAPYACKLTKAEIKEKVMLALQEENPNYFAVVKVDRPFTGR